MYWLCDCCKCIYANLFFIAIGLKNAPNPGGVLARIIQRKCTEPWWGFDKG
jgi:hypothetical protein